MKQIFIVEAKGQKDEISTPSLYNYKVFGTKQEAENYLAFIYNNLKSHHPNSTRENGVVTCLPNFGLYPRQYWVLKTYNV